MGVFYVDGAFVPESEAVLPVSDLAILRGYGVFDFLRTYGGQPFHLEAHIRRLRNSAALIGLRCPWPFENIVEIVERTLEKNDYPESNIRLLITGGDSGDSITPGEKPRLLVMVTPLKSFPEQWYKDGVKVITAEISRYIPGAKSIDYIRAIVTLNQARDAGAVESIYVNEQGQVLEGTTSNIFAFIGGKLVTPPEEILPGVTRDVTLEIAAPRFKTELRTLSRDELQEADEVFLSSSNKEILPVVQVDDRKIGNGRPGPQSRQIMEMFAAYTRAYSGQ